MPKHRAPSSQPETALPPPDVIGVLPPVPGGEENLLPKDAWLRPLRVEFGWWDDPAHLPGFADVVQLIWDDDEANPVAVKSYDESHYPDPPPDLWLEVPIARLEEGIHTLYYRLLPWNGSSPISPSTNSVSLPRELSNSIRFRSGLIGPGSTPGSPGPGRAKSVSTSMAPGESKG